VVCGLPFTATCNARKLYYCRYALDHIPKNQAASLYTRFVTFEKQHGDREGIEDVVVSKRRCVCVCAFSVSGMSVAHKAKK
jgi:hypothetical protein